MVHNYIVSNWDNTTRNQSCKGHGMVIMPKPFSSPSIEPIFEDFYYWDTYFINLGLISDAKLEQAKNNLDNIAFFIKHLGYMPNASHLFYTSQPPLFARAVYDYYLKVKDKNVLKEYIDAIVSEHDFFEHDRNSSIGLAKYGCVNFIKSQLDRHYSYFSDRVSINKKTASEKYSFVKDMFAVMESGWDCTPRFDSKNKKFDMSKYIPIDLNCILYDMEIKIAEMYNLLEDKQSSKKYKKLADKRKEKINKYLLNNKDGLYRDYNYKDKEFSKVISTASFYPYAMGISDDRVAVKKLLSKMELNFGVSTCEYTEKEEYLQWDYPIMWAPQMYFVYEALVNVGLKEEAKRISKKYIRAVENNFEQTGVLWEKYNALDGGVGDTKESESHPMLGWTAGVYEYLLDKEYYD